MSDRRAWLLLLSNMNASVMLTLWRSRPSSTRPPLAGRLHEMAITRPVAAPEVWWRQHGVAGGARTPNPQISDSVGGLMTVLGRPGNGEGARVKRLLADAMRSWPVVAIDPHDGHEELRDELAGCEPLDLSGSVSVIDPIPIRVGPGDVCRLFDDGIAGEW